MPDGNGAPTNGKFLLDLLKWAGPVVLALVAGYGSVQLASGAREQRISNLEMRMIELEKRAESNRQRFDLFVSREELKGYLEGQTRTLEQIQADVRALRNGR